MSYVESVRRQRHPGAVIAVLAIEAGIAWGLMSGLVGSYVPRNDTRIRTTDIKLPSPEQTKKDPPVHHETTPSIPQHTETQITLVPQNVDTFTPTFTDHGEAGSIGEVEFVHHPIDPPPPRFTPKAPRARGKPGLWVTPNDYPSSELRLEHQGTTRFAVTVGADGKPKACTVTGSSGWPALDATACAKIMARASFDPATGSDGEKSAGIWNSAVQWEIPQ
jgi:protein TonB